MLCDSCEVLYINGIKTHEIGCPNAWKDGLRECKWCGSDFKPEEEHQKCCCHSCDVAYYNFDCNCDECSPPKEYDDDESYAADLKYDLMKDRRMEERDNG